MSKLVSPIFIILDFSIENLHGILNLVFYWLLIIKSILGNVAVLTEIGYAIVELNLVEEGLIFETDELIIFGFALKEEVTETLL